MSNILFCYAHHIKIMSLWKYKYLWCSFKLALVSPTKEEFEILQEDLKKRLHNNQGECIYDVGTSGEKTWSRRQSDTADSGIPYLGGPCIISCSITYSTQNYLKA